VWKGAYHFFSLQELVVLMMIYPYVTSDKKGRRRAFLFGVLAGGAIIELTTLASNLVLGHSITSNQLFPAYVLAKHISIGQFLERLEAMMMFIWILTIFIKTTITFHSSAIGLSQLLRLGDEKPYLAPLAMNMIVLSLLCYPNVPYVRKMLAECWTPFAFLFMVLLPVILLGAAAIRQRTSTANANAS
jgi:spore germination protein KB